MPNIDRTRRGRRRIGALGNARAERALLPLARNIATLAGFVDASGFLAFAGVYLASPEPDGTTLAVAIVKNHATAYLLGALVISFVVGAVLATLCVYWLTHYRRTAIISGAASCVAFGFICLERYSPSLSLALLAAAMGALHCVFERDPRELQEALLPSAQMLRVGEALGSRWGANEWHALGRHGLFWISFVVGGASGAITWLVVGAWTVMIAAAGTIILAIYAWLIERNLPET